jgi:hypothetical protein
MPAFTGPWLSLTPSELHQLSQRIHVVPLGTFTSSASASLHGQHQRRWVNGGIALPQETWWLSYIGRANCKPL